MATNSENILIFYSHIKEYEDDCENIKLCKLYVKYIQFHMPRECIILELTFPAMEQRLKESWKPLLNTIPAFKGSAECLAGRRFLKIIHRWHHNCFNFTYNSHNKIVSQMPDYINKVNEE